MGRFRWKRDRLWLRKKMNPSCFWVQGRLCRSSRVCVCVCYRERETERETQERDRGTDIPTCLQVLSSKPQIPTNATYFWKTPVHNFRSSEKPQCCVFLKGQWDLTFCPLMSSRWWGLCPRPCLCLRLPPSMGLSISRHEAERKQHTPPPRPIQAVPAGMMGCR